MLTQARGWIARFSHTTDNGNAYHDQQPIVCWRETDDGVVGLIADGKRGLRSAVSFSNFIGYAEDEPQHLVAATPGWWCVQRNESGAYWSRIIAWTIGEGGYGVRAVGTPDLEGAVWPEDADEDTRFVYAPERESEGQGSWPDESGTNGVAEHAKEGARTR